MTAKIYSFGGNNKVPQVKKQQVKDAGGEDLPMPSKEDLAGFINVLNFLALQSATNSVEIAVMVDELNISIKHHDDLIEGDEVTSATSYEVLANAPYDAEATDKTKTIDNLLEMFDKLDISKYDSE